MENVTAGDSSFPT